jgi:hypothetical protein
MACSAVTITPGFQNTPLDENRGRACTATTDFPAPSTAAASSFESAANSFAIEISCDFRMAWMGLASHRKFGRVAPGHSYWYRFS